jgi:hypothetical protein
MREIIYIAGRYGLPHDGMMKRIRLVISYFEEIYPNNPRYLLAEKPFQSEELERRGWECIQIDGSLQKRKSVRRVSRLLTVIGWRYLRSNPAGLLSLLGGSALCFDESVEGVFRRMPRALVLAGRCDLTGFVQYRTPGQNWVLDSTDSVTNLELTYRRADVWRMISLTGRKNWIDRISDSELNYARRYDRVINISKEDDLFFSEISPSKRVLEDTAVVLDDHPCDGEKEYDIGYIGGTFIGSVKAAESLVRIAESPLLKGIRFGIAGSVCKMIDRARLPNNLILVGPVEDASRFVRSCRSIVQIAGKETGASIKFQEALANECTIVCNSNAARFSKSEPGKTHLQFDSIDELLELYASGAVWRFQPKSIKDHFKRAAFYERFGHALGW